MQGKKHPKKLQPMRKGPYQIIEKPTDVTCNLIDTNKKEIIQHRNNLLPYYPNENALRELTQLYSYTGINFAGKPSEFDKQSKSQLLIHSLSLHETNRKQITKNTPKENMKNTQKQIP